MEVNSRLEEPCPKCSVSRIGSSWWLLMHELLFVLVWVCMWLEAVAREGFDKFMWHKACLLMRKFDTRVSFVWSTVNPFNYSSVFTGRHWTGLSEQLWLHYFMLLRTDTDHRTWKADTHQQHHPRGVFKRVCRQVAFMFGAYLFIKQYWVKLQFISVLVHLRLAAFHWTHSFTKSWQKKAFFYDALWAWIILR